LSKSRKRRPWLRMIRRIQCRKRQHGAELWTSSKG
jgi:hypothetical protein